MPFYKNLQMIAYEISTDFWLDIGAPYAPNSPELKAWLKDNGANLSKGASSHLAHIVAIAELAWSKADHQTPNTLKVFMAPEFYFRPPGANQDDVGAYSETDRALIEDALRTVFASKDYKDWVLVLGTIIWKEDTNRVLEAALRRAVQPPDDDELANILKKNRAGGIIWNTALIAIGGTDRLVTFAKRKYPLDDGIPAENDPSQFVAKNVDAIGNEYKVKVRDLILERQNQSNLDCFIRVDNLLFSVEVCADHLELRIESKLKTWRKNNKHEQNAALDFQILTACGASIQADRVVIGKGQFFLRVDGSSPAVAIKDTNHASEIQRVVDVVDNKGTSLAVMCICESKDKQLKDDWDKINLKDRHEFKVTKDLILSPTQLQSRRFAKNLEDVPKEFLTQMVVVYPLQSMVHVIDVEEEQQPLQIQEDANAKLGSAAGPVAAVVEK